MSQFARSDLGNAEMLAEKYRGKLLYDHEQGRWWCWNGNRWQPDRNGEALRCAARVIRERKKAAGAGDEKGEFAWSLKSEGEPRLKAMLNLAKSRPHMPISHSEWDANPWLLGCANGVLDLRTGELKPAEPGQYISRSTLIEYDPGVTCPRWLETIESYWPNDSETRDFVQRAVGYSLTGLTTEQVFFCLWGQGGNGKSTFLGVLKNLMGDYAYTMPFSTMEFNNRSAISNDVAALQGRRFVLSSETQEDIRLNEGRIKSLTGDSTITARFLHREYFTFQPVGKFWLAFNHKPRILDASDGIWRRLRLIGFEQQFTGANRVKGLEEELKVELPGILNWALQGCLAWRRTGLPMTDAIKQATDDYRVESNGLVEFIEECCEVRADLRIPKQALFDAYIAWASRVKERFPFSKNGFGSRLAGLGYADERVKVNGRTRRFWSGIGLLPDWDPIDDTEIVTKVTQ